MVSAIYPPYLELRYSYYRVHNCCTLCKFCEMLMILITYAKIKYCVLSLLLHTTYIKKSSLNKKVRIQHTGFNNPPSCSAVAKRPERSTYPSARNNAIYLFTAVTKAELWRLSVLHQKINHIPTQNFRVIITQEMYHFSANGAR